MKEPFNLKVSLFGSHALAAVLLVSGLYFQVPFITFCGVASSIGLIVHDMYLREQRSR